MLWIVCVGMLVSIGAFLSFRGNHVAAAPIGRAVSPRPSSHPGCRRFAAARCRGNGRAHQDSAHDETAAGHAPQPANGRVAATARVPWPAGDPSRAVTSCLVSRGGVRRDSAAADECARGHLGDRSTSSARSDHSRGQRRLAPFTFPSPRGRTVVRPPTPPRHRGRGVRLCARRGLGGEGPITPAFTRADRYGQVRAHTNAECVGERGVDGPLEQRPPIDSHQENETERTERTNAALWSEVPVSRPWSRVNADMGAPPSESGEGLPQIKRSITCAAAIRKARTRRAYAPNVATNVHAPLVPQV